MVFRRRRFPMRRRRRRLPETYTRKLCRECINVYGQMTCSNPHIDIFEILSMSTPRNSADATEVTNPTNKFIVFDGMKFQSEYFHDPLTTFECASSAAGQFATRMAFILTIWEAVVLLPTGEGSTIAPAYLPNLAQGIFQEGDTADRVLWKRLRHLYVQGVNSNLTGTPFSNPDSTLRYQGSGPVVVKSRCRIDDRHALYYVRNFVHDVALAFPAANPCNPTLDCQNCQQNDGDSQDCGFIPVTHDFYSKIFYHTRN